MIHIFKRLKPVEVEINTINGCIIQLNRLVVTKRVDIFLRKNGFYQKAFPILYFSNDCILNIESRHVKIINDPVLVIDYIKRYNEQGVYLPQEVQEKYCKCIKTIRLNKGMSYQI